MRNHSENLDVVALSRCDDDCSGIAGHYLHYTVRRVELCLSDDRYDLNWWHVQDVRQGLNDTSYVVVARDTRQFPEISFMDVNRGLMRKLTVRKVGAQ